MKLLLCTSTWNAMEEEINRFHSVAEITPEKQNWKIMVRVIRLWVVKDLGKSKIPFSMELLLVDSKGVRIHASLRKTVIYKFQKDLREGSVYSIRTFDVAENSDVMGVLTGVGTERQFSKNGSNTKMNVICVEANGDKIECTLFGNYVDELNTFLASGDVNSTIVIVHLAKVKCFQDKIHLQNCMVCTKLIFKPKCEEVMKLAKRMLDNMESPSQGLSQLTDSGKVSMEEDFLELTTKKTIKGLKDCKEESSYAVFATVNNIMEDEDWFYTACLCNKGVYPDSQMWFCEKCERHVVKVVVRYRIKVRVTDHTDSATFVIFDRDATMLFNKSCTDMYEEQEKKGNSRGLPKEISDLEGKSFIFKVDFRNGTSSKFEQSFRVKKICDDVLIMKRFKEYLATSIEANMDVQPMDFAQDLMPKFSMVGVDNENDSQMDEIQIADLSKDSQDFTPLKANLASPNQGGSLIGSDSQHKEQFDEAQTDSAELFSPIGTGFASQDVTPIGTSCGIKLNEPHPETPKAKTEAALSTQCVPGKRQLDLDVPLKGLRKKIKIEKL